MRINVCLVEHFALQDSDTYLSAHNAYRSAVGVSSFTWDDTLQSNAEQWAQHLADNKLLKHSDVTDQGENLWKGGPNNHYMMIQDWGDAKSEFVNNAFPEVSKTGNWVDVGHYTQIIWKDTVKVGCGGWTGKGHYKIVHQINI
jgi:hypothetical protein